jgi:hypothetical protein
VSVITAGSDIAIRAKRFRRKGNLLHRTFFAAIDSALQEPRDLRRVTRIASTLLPNALSGAANRGTGSGSAEVCFTVGGVEVLTILGEIEATLFP